MTVGPTSRPTLVYLLPTNHLFSTYYDPQGRPTVLDLLSPEAVGRLDVDSTGALLLMMET